MGLAALELASLAEAAGEPCQALRPLLTGKAVLQGGFVVRDGFGFAAVLVEEESESEMPPGPARQAKLPRLLAAPGQPGSLGTCLPRRVS